VAIRLYLDTNVLCRPFDDQTGARVRRETEAFGRILEKISNNEAVYFISDILMFELRRIVLPAKRAKVFAYLDLSRGFGLRPSG
jgi:predicted nucleic acid-binding protein